MMDHQRKLLELSDILHKKIYSKVEALTDKTQKTEFEKGEFEAYIDALEIIRKAILEVF